LKSKQGSSDNSRQEQSIDRFGITPRKKSGKKMAASRYIVTLVSGTSNAERDAVIHHVESLGGTTTHVYDIFPGFAFSITEDRFPAALAFLQADARFQDIEADGIVTAN
jgi:hypothetical protein